jgi:hypothetical protein
MKRGRELFPRYQWFESLASVGDQRRDLCNNNFFHLLKFEIKIRSGIKGS